MDQICVFRPELTSSFFCLDTKESKNQGLQNTLASILSNCKCGRVIYSAALRSFPSLLTICFVFPCRVLMAESPNCRHFFLIEQYLVINKNSSFVNRCSVFDITHTTVKKNFVEERMLKRSGACSEVEKN
jgi:hypothetical protein